ncbi:MAG: hypothetical protein GY906_39030 [bacterium]|nr:hypothetical protein [bacterium]
MTINIGDRVRFSKSFLRRCKGSPDFAEAIGTVTGIEESTSPALWGYAIQWDKPIKSNISLKSVDRSHSARPCNIERLSK